MTVIPLKKRLKIYAGDVAYMSKRLLPRSGSGFRVLLYHSITDGPVRDEWAEETIHKSLFKRQMRYLREEKYEVISCAQAVGYLSRHQEIPIRTVAITFDDGYRDNYINALPILEKYNFRATVFLTVGFLRDYSGDARRLSRCEISDAAKSGVIDFGCHTFSHRILTALKGPELDEEIKGAKEKLQDIVKDKVDLFSYPFGHKRSYNETIFKAVKSAGFKGAFTATFGLNNSNTDPYLVRRNRISWLDELGEFKKHLCGAYDWYGLCQSIEKKRYGF